MDLSRFSTEDLKALRDNDLSRVSTEGLKLLQAMVPAEPVAEPRQSTILGEGKRGLEQLVSSTVTGLFGSPEEAALSGLQRSQRIAEEAGEGPSLDRIKRIFQEQGFLEASKAVVGDVPRVLAGQGANLAAMAGGARLGAMAGTPFGPPGTMVGGGLGALAAIAPSVYGQMIERQAEEQQQRGEPVAIQRGPAAAATAGSLALEVGGTAAAAGKTLIKKVLGIADDPALLARTSQEALVAAANRSLTGTVARGAGRGAAVEMPVEVAQTIMERAQAGLPVTGDEAYEEYGEAAYLGGVAGGGIGAVGGVSSRGAARRGVAAEEARVAEAQRAGPPLPGAEFMGPPEPPPVQGTLFDGPRQTQVQDTPTVADRTRRELEEANALREETERLQREYNTLRDQVAADKDAGVRFVEREKRLADADAAVLEARAKAQELPTNIDSVRDQFDRLQRENQRLRSQYEQEADPAKKAAIFAEAERLAPQLRAMQDEYSRLRRVTPENAPGARRPQAPEGQLELAFDDTIRIQDLPNYGIPMEGGSPAVVGVRGWLRGNVLGKTPEQVRRMTEKQPDLLQGRGLRARVLKEMIAPQPQAYQQPMEAPSEPRAADRTAEQPELELGGAEPSVGVSGEPTAVPTGVVEPAAQPEVTEPTGLGGGEPPAGGRVDAKVGERGALGGRVAAAQWEEFKPDGAPTYDQLPLRAQSEWAKRATRPTGVVTMQDADDIFNDAVRDVGFQAYSFKEQNPKAEQMFADTTEGRVAKAFYDALPEQGKKQVEQERDKLAEQKRAGSAAVKRQEEAKRRKSEEEAEYDEAEKERQREEAKRKKAEEKEPPKPRKERRSEKFGTTKPDEKADKEAKEKAAKEAKEKAAKEAAAQEAAAQEAAAQEAAAQEAAIKAGPPRPIAVRKGTPEQLETANLHQESQGGVIVWQDGDYALLRIFRNLEPVYLGINQRQRTFIDITEYDGDVIPPEVQGEMKFVKRALEKEAAAKHASDPFIKFDKDGLALSEGISAEYAGIIREWKKLLKINDNVYVTTIQDGVENKDNFTGPHRIVGFDATNANVNTGGGTRPMADGSHHILIRLSPKKTENLETIAHEMGHIHQREVFNNASNAEQAALYKAHDQWLKSLRGKTAKDLVESMRGRAVGDVKGDLSIPVEKLNPYWFKFNEWYADQVARWAVSSDRPVTIVEKFFARLGASLRKFYNTLKAKKYLPNETFAQYIEAVTRPDKLDLQPMEMKVRPTDSSLDKLETAVAPSTPEPQRGEVLGARKREETIREYQGVRARIAALVRRLAKTVDDSSLTSLPAIQQRIALLDNYARDLKDEIDSTRKPRTSAEDFLARATKAYADGDIDTEVFDAVRALYDKLPFLLDGIRLSVAKAPEGKESVGEFIPFARLVKLYKDTEGVLDSKTIRHEVAHSMEQMMDADQRKVVLNEYSKQLTKAIKDNKDNPEAQKYFDAVIKFLDSPSNKTLQDAIDLMPSYDYYQYVNPSEYWAVNAETMLKSNLGSAWNRFKLNMRQLFEGLKSAFGFNNRYQSHKVMRDLLQGKAERMSRDLLLNYISDVSSDIDAANVAQNVTAATPPPLQQGFSPVPGGLNRVTSDAVWEGILKLRTQLADKGAYVFDRIAKGFNDEVNTALKGKQVEAGFRQAEASDQFLPQFFRLGAMIRDKITGQWEAVKNANIRPPAEIIDDVRTYAKDNNLDFDAAYKEVSDILQAAREHAFREHNATRSKGEDAMPRHMPDDEVDRLYPIYQSDATIKKIVKTMDKVRFDLIDHMVDVGRIPKELGQEWKDATNYIPFDRLPKLGEKPRTPQKRTGRGIGQLGKLPELVDAELVSLPPKNTIDNYFGTIGWMAQQVIRQDATLRTLRALENIGEAKLLNTRQFPRQMADRVATTYIKGEERYFEVASPYHKVAFNVMSAPTLPIFKVFQRFSQVLRHAITAVPTFTASQLPQDIQRAIMYSGVQNPAALTAKVLANFKDFSKAAVLGKLAEVAPELGTFGVVGGVDFHMSDPAKTFLTDMGVYKDKLLGSTKFATLLKRLEGIAMASDIAMRKAIYDQTLEETQGDRLQALTRAREIINFRRFGAGDKLGLLHLATQTVPFYNAYLQGTDVLFRSLTGKNAVSGLARNAALKHFYKNVGYLVAASTVYAMMMADEEDYENMDLRERDRTWVIGGGIGLPVPGELGVLFKAIPERVVEYYRKAGTPEEAVAMEAIIAHFKTGIASEYFGRAIPMPVAIKPLLEVWTNYSFLTGRELEGISQKQLEASERVTSRTSELAKAVARFAADATNGSVQISPISIDTVLQGYLGTTAGLTMAVADQALNSDRADRPLHQIVGATPFAYDPVGTRRATEFYELREKVVQSQNTLNRLIKQDPERAAEYYERNAERLAIYKMVNSTLQQLEDSRRYKQWLDTEMAAGTMSSEERMKMKQEVQAYEQKLVEWVRDAKNEMKL